MEMTTLEIILLAVKLFDGTSRCSSVPRSDLTHAAMLETLHDFEPYLDRLFGGVESCITA